MRQLQSIFVFYSQFIFWSLAINLAFGLFNFHLVPALIAKLLLTILVWYLIKQTKANDTFLFYKNLGISELKLFSMTFLVDSLITLSFLWMFHEFY